MGLSQRDWTLHRKGPADAARHAEKLKEAIRENLQDIVSEESIISSDGKRMVKIPVRGLDLPYYRYGRPGKYVGQGSGGTEQGDVVAQDQQPGPGGKAGREPGQDYYEVGVSIDELAELVFADMKLPNLKHKKSNEIESEAVAFNDVRKKGLFPNLDKRRTLLANAKRRAMDGKKGVGDFNDDDLRYKTWVQVTKPDTSAVVIAMRDVSGSMGTFEKYMTRVFYFWIVRFLRTHYQNVKIVFLTHHTEAQEVDEAAFFDLSESGGTMVSSVYELADRIIQERYNPANWNIYAFHFSDGDNWGDDDNVRCVNLVRKLLGVCNIFGYTEVDTHGRGFSALMRHLIGIDDHRLVTGLITSKADVWPCLLRLFSREI